MFHHSPHSKRATGDKRLEKFLKDYIQNIMIVDNQIIDEFGTIIGEIDILSRGTILFHKTIDKFHHPICKDGWRKGITFFCKDKKLCDKAYVGESGKKMKNVSFLKNILNDDLVIIDFTNDYLQSKPLEIEGVSDNRSFFLPEKIQKMVQAYDYSNFTPRTGKFNKKWEMFRNFEMFYKKICDKLKLDGWTAIVFSDQPKGLKLKEFAIIDAHKKMKTSSCDIDGNHCIECPLYIMKDKIKKKYKKRSKSRSRSHGRSRTRSKSRSRSRTRSKSRSRTRSKSRSKKYVPKPPSKKKPKKNNVYSHRIKFK